MNFADELAVRQRVLAEARVCLAQAIPGHSRDILSQTIKEFEEFTRAIVTVALNCSSVSSNRYHGSCRGVAFTIHSKQRKKKGREPKLCWTFEVQGIRSPQSFDTVLEAISGACDVIRSSDPANAAELLSEHKHAFNCAMGTLAQLRSAASRGHVSSRLDACLVAIAAQIRTVLEQTKHLTREIEQLAELSRNACEYVEQVEEQGAVTAGVVVSFFDRSKVRKST